MKFILILMISQIWSSARVVVPLKTTETSEWIRLRDREDSAAAAYTLARDARRQFEEKLIVTYDKSISTPGAVSRCWSTSVMLNCLSISEDGKYLVK